MANTADVTGYLFAACMAGGVVAYLAPTVRDWISKQTIKGISRQVTAKEWLKQFKPEQIAVIRNYLEHGGYSAGVAAVVGDLNFLMLAGDIGDTLRECPDMLEKAMLAPPAPPG